MRHPIHVWLHRFLVLLALAVVFPTDLLGQRAQAGDTVATIPSRTTRRITYKDFFDMQTTLEDLRREMNRLRVDVEAYRSRELTPEVYRTILRRLSPPPLTHEVVLTNGTIVRGNIIAENIDELTIETTLGNLMLDKSHVRSIQDIRELKPKFDFLGDAREEIHDDHRIYTGQVKNAGVSRADFVRVVFRLWNAKTELVAEDSSFVVGTDWAYLSGVHSDSAVEAGLTGDYRVKVKTDRDSAVSYITREIHWDQMN